MIKWLFLFFFFSTQVFAAQKGSVVTEGAIVYKGPSFDAPILGYFSAGKKVSLSNKLFGAFYKVRFKQGIIGYISDIDVRPDNAKAGSDFFPGSENEEKNKDRPFFGSTHIGITYAMIGFEDTVGGFTDNSQTSFIGGVLTTPFTFLDGSTLLSVNVLYSLEVPQFYSKISKNAPEGFVIIGDISLLYPLASFLDRKLTAFVGAGLGLAYTDVDLVQEIGGSPKLVPTSSAKIGGVFSGGLVYKFSSFALRFEPKYYYEENAYLGITSSLSFQF